MHIFSWIISSESKLRMKPTPEQEKIFHFIKSDTKHGIINAVAGSGKTTTIIASIACVQPGKSLLFCAFNKSIRDEIKARISAKGYDDVVVKNLHQLGFDILRSNSGTAYQVDTEKYLKIVDKLLKTDLEDPLKRYLDLYGVNAEPKNGNEERVLMKHIYTFKKKLTEAIDKVRLTLTNTTFSSFKEMMIHFSILDDAKTEDALFDEEIHIFRHSVAEALHFGNHLARETGLIDLTDMLYLPQYLELYPKKNYDLLFVDECQDLSKAQFAIALKYVKKGGRIIAVGDPSQSIYGFTGADIESFDRFGRVLKNHEKLTLSFCFRCPDKVIEYAQSFREDMQSFVSKEGMIERIEFHQVREMAKNRDLIISRTKAPLITLLFVLLENNRPVNIQEEEVHDLFNELRFLFSAKELSTLNARDQGPYFFEKVIQRNIRFTEKYAGQIRDAEQREKFLKEETRYIEQRVDFIEKQLSIQTDVKTVNDLIKRIEHLLTRHEDAIQLSTIHKSKGLENERVFILNYDQLPLKKDWHKNWETAQERNLKYVALTRTKHTLYLVNSLKEETVTHPGSLYDEVEWH